MQTIVGISLSPVYILPLMFTFSIIGRTLLFRVRYFLSDTGHLWYKTHPAVPVSYTHLTLPTNRDV